MYVDEEEYGYSAKRNMSDMSDAIEETKTKKKFEYNRAQKCLDEIKSEKDFSTIVIKLNNISFCFSRENINNIIQEVWIQLEDSHNFYVYLESLNLFLTDDFRNKLKHGNVFTLSKKGNGNFVKAGQEFEQDVVLNTDFYTAEDVSKKSNMDLLTNLFSGMKMEEKKTVDNLDNLVDILSGMKIEEKDNEITNSKNEIMKNLKYQCENVVDKTQDIFIFQITGNYYCMNIDEVIFMVENYWQSETSKERFYKLPFNNICIDESLIPLFEKKISAITLSFKDFKTLERKNNEEGEFKIFTASKLENIPANLNFSKKFKGDVLFDIEIYKGGIHGYSITYRRKGSEFRYRNNAPDSFNYSSTTGELQTMEWHQQNKHRHRNGLIGPGKVSFKNGRKEKEEFYNDNDKLHSYNDNPAVIFYNPNDDRGIITKKEYYNNGNLVKMDIFDFGTGKFLYTKEIDQREYIRRDR